MLKTFYFVPLLYVQYPNFSKVLLSKVPLFLLSNLSQSFFLHHQNLISYNRITKNEVKCTNIISINWQRNLLRAQGKHFGERKGLTEDFHRHHLCLAPQNLRKMERKDNKEGNPKKKKKKVNKKNSLKINKLFVFF